MTSDEQTSTQLALVMLLTGNDNQFREAIKYLYDKVTFKSASSSLVKYLTEHYRDDNTLDDRISRGIEIIKAMQNPTVI